MESEHRTQEMKSLTERVERIRVDVTDARAYLDFLFPPEDNQGEPPRDYSAVRG